jgi:hypothetical protein
MTSYGTPSGVASHAKRWTRGGVFYDAAGGGTPVAPTNPTLTEVTTWLTQVSSLFDTALMNEGFVTPVTETNSVLLLTLETERLVADLCDRANNSGRLVSDMALARGYMAVVGTEVRTWVKEKVVGFENAGVPRTNQMDDGGKNFSFTGVRQT